MFLEKQPGGFFVVPCSIGHRVGEREKERYKRQYLHDIDMNGVAGMSKLIAVLKSSSIVFDAEIRSSFEASTSSGAASPIGLSRLPFTSMPSPYILRKA